MTICCVTRIVWTKYFVTPQNERLDNVSKRNLYAARVELLQVSKVEGEFETAIPLTFNRYSAYLQQLYPCC